MATTFRDKAIFDNELIIIVQSNIFPPQSEFVDKFTTTIRLAFPKLDIEIGKYPPRNDETPLTLQQLGLLPKKQCHWRKC